jgi:predicted O-linked N-acetylglucosamine transferase (SPINDLY family)
MARKPAPVQVAWLAYPGTTGLTAIDYRLTDPYLDPPGDADLNYCEKSIRLPNTFWCYAPFTAGPQPNALPANTNGFITFGCLNNYCKMSSGTIALWARVLAAVENSRLIMLCPVGQHRNVLLKQFQSAGVEPQRIEFVKFIPRGEYLLTYHRIDIGLDTLPYNGHTTSLDSYWMGVPVISRIGRTVVGRAGLSQLSNLGLAEFATDGDEKFIDLCKNLANDLNRLSELRATLRGRMEKSPLMDAPLFARNIESAYRSMWKQWCESQLSANDPSGIS